MVGRRAFVVVAGVLVTTALAIAACETFEAAPEPPPDGGADGSDPSDGTTVLDGAGPDVTSDAATDAPSGACEVLVGVPFTTAEASVTALAADGTHVYWGSTQGASRESVAAGGPEAIVTGLGTCTDIVLGADFIAARFAGGAVRVKAKSNIVADASVPNLSGNATGLDPRAATTFFARRTEAAFNCPSTSTSCSELVDRPSMTSIVPAAVGGFDFMAAYGPAAGVFHCASNCAAADSGVLLATASQASTKVTSDDAFVYFLDRTNGAVRKVARTGGSPSDVVIGLVEPIDFEIDSMGRFVIATFVNGVFRAPKTGCVAPTTAVGPSIGGLGVYGTTVWYAEGAEIKRVP